MQFFNTTPKWLYSLQYICYFGDIFVLADSCEITIDCCRFRHVYKKKLTNVFYFCVLPREEPMGFFLFCGDGRVPYNAYNTAGSNVAQEHFKV